MVHHDVTTQFITLGVFVTLCYARLDLQHGQLTLVDCGHTKTVHFRHSTSSCVFLQGDNMPLGFSAQECYRQVVFPLAAGDVLVFYSDGVTEARNSTGAFFGVERLLEVIQAHHSAAPEQLIDRIRQAVVDFTAAEARADDLTCVVITLAPPASACPLARAHYAVPGSTTALLPLRRFVRQFCQSLSGDTLDAESLGQLELAVTEAASNIMRHAYQGRADQTIQVIADAYADRIVIRLLHHGTAFNPATVRPPAFDGSRDGGFGVYIMAHTVDEVRYSREAHGAHGISLVKKRPAG
jgi:sigma-B regulation protein RsbU (phosphoserine phosphatase)